MLSYEDSEQLKKLRYPQELRDGDWFYYRGATEPVLYVKEAVEPEGCWPVWSLTAGYVKVPTTDGMIEGLNDHFESLVRYPDGGGFWATGVWGSGDSAEAYGTFIITKGARRGHSPDQALCELYKKIKSECKP